MHGEDSERGEREKRPETEAEREALREKRWMKSNAVVSPPVLRKARKVAPGREGGQEGKEGEDSGDGKKGNPDEPKRPLTKKEKRAQRRKKREERRKSRIKMAVLIGIGLIVLVAALVIGVPWYLHARQFENTDDAFIDAHYEKVGPQVSGRVTRVLVEDNEWVEAGTTLVEIDSADYRARLDQAEAAVAEAQAQVQQQQAQEEVAVAAVAQAESDRDAVAADLANAKAELARYQALSDDAQIKQRLDDLRTNVTRLAAQLRAAEVKIESTRKQVGLARAQTAAARAGVQAREAEVEAAKLQESYTTVKATISGRVTNRTVQAGDFVAVGRQLLLIVPENVWVTANYKETQLTDMKEGQEVEISVDAYPDKTLKGKVDSIQKGSGAVFSLLPPENATGNYVKVVQRVPVKIVFTEKDSEIYKRLGPGMSVTPKVKVK